MLWHGRTFQDADFFAADGFSAQLELGAAKVPMQRRSDGTFVARIKATELSDQPLVARFHNQWLQLTAGAIGQELPVGMKLVVPSPLVVKDETIELCLQVTGCCSDLTPGAATRILLRGQHPHYHPEALPLLVSFSVDKTPFLICWWRVIAAILGTLFVIFLLVGFLSPHDFDAVEVIRLAKTEAALQRTSGRRLSDLPGSKRGFYRHRFRAAYNRSQHRRTQRPAHPQVGSAQGSA